MNRREAGEGLEKARRISNCFKDRDEELSFFRDLKKHEKDQFASLLQPISDDFEANGSFGLSRMNSGGRRGEFLGETGKNDYNWLKTPPATPLFPSLEMETIGQELIVQREIPIIQPLSRFAGNSECNKSTSNNIPTSPIPKPRLPQWHKTPTARPSIPSFIDKRNMKTAPLVSHKPNIACADKTKPTFTPIVKSTIQKESRSNFPNSNTPKSTRVEPHSSAKSPILGVSNETPINLRTTNRPTSATRGRPSYQNLPTPQKQDTNTSTSTKIRRQSCSPSVARGRKSESDGNLANQSGGSKGGIRGQVVGSRMVDKFMNARMSNNDDRKSKIKLNGSMNESSMNVDRKSKVDECKNGEKKQPKVKLNGSLNESSGFGRLMSKNSLDMALKHMDIQRDSSNGRKIGMVPGRKS